MATERNLDRLELKRLGCPHWPDPTGPQAIAWLANRAAAKLAREGQSA